MIPKYEDFYLTVDGRVGGYTVAAQGPADIRVPPVPFEFRETDELRIELNQIKLGFAPSSERMLAVGSMLFKALFPIEVISAYVDARAAAAEAAGLRLKLIVRPPELSDLPWELTYHLVDKIYLASTQSHAFVRYIEQGRPAESLLARRPLRVLYVQANPGRTNQLDTAASERAIKVALGEDGEVVSIYSVTPSSLRNALREGSYHVLHYDGHGVFDEEAKAGYLCLHDEQGATYQLRGEMLVTYLDGTPVRLVVLSACETAADSKEKRFSGIAQQLMRSTRLPALVAMQYDIPDKSALAFARGFYEALADDYPVDAAVVQGRQSILESLGLAPFGSSDWATPVLFMRVKDGNILKSESEEDRSMAESEDKKEGKHIDTGGGAYIGGGVNTGGGDFIGRDKNVGGDDIKGDIKVEGGISGTGIAIGHKAQAQVSQGSLVETSPKIEAFAVARIEGLPEEETALVGQPITLLTGVVKAIKSGFEATPVTLVPKDERQQSFTLEIVVYSEFMDISPARSQAFTFYRDRESDLLDFTLTPRALGPQSIDVEFYHARHWLGRIQLEVNVVETLTAELIP